MKAQENPCFLRKTLKKLHPFHRIRRKNPRIRKAIQAESVKMKLADPALFSLGIHPYGKERETMNLRFRKLTAAIVSLLVAISSVSPVFAAEADEIPDAESTSYSAAAPQSNEKEISPFSTGITYYVAANGSDRQLRHQLTLP